MNFYDQRIQQTNATEYRFESKDFDSSYWQTQADTKILDGGRGGSFLIYLQEQPFVLHQYLRGGMLARVLYDQYVWTGTSQTRPFLEMQVVNHALDNGLPVPQMVAYQVKKSGLFYRAVSISRYIENRGSLAARITGEPLPLEQWFQLGVLIKKMHACSIDHADLNANNILVSDVSNFYLIDFDKATIKINGDDWKRSNLNRLKRSLLKIQSLLQQQGKNFYFSELDWSSFKEGYQT